MGRPLASALTKYTGMIAFDDLMQERFSDLELKNLLIYLIDNITIEALPALADQFDALGVKGFKYADTEKKKRDLLKSILEIRQYKGTPWAIKQALSVIGYTDVKIIERVGAILHNGEIARDGSNTHGAGRLRNGVLFRNGAFRHTSTIVYWATFRVVINIDSVAVVDSNAVADISALVNENKNERSKLMGVSFASELAESIELTESFTVNII
jgi:P2-related tail formation protein